ncbi:MAG: hypothetical protein QNJ47_12600 [Nostocaceae cyanobacterium]|nr:hypothetical protein [Nostocaceae cyanobacterium]
MLPSKFVEAAGLPVRWREKDLQEYIASELRQNGFSVRTEVPCNGGRADIVSNWQGGTVIEVKKYLDRNSIYQAFGQLNLYGLNNQHKLVVMGFLTLDANEQSSALKTASMIEQNQRTKVIFLNIEQEWLPKNQFSLSWMSKVFPLPKLSLPKLHLGNCNTLFSVIKANPLLLVLVVAYLAIVASNFTQIEVLICKHFEQIHNCFKSEKHH